MEARWEVCYTDRLPHVHKYKIVEDIVRQHLNVIFVGTGADDDFEMRHGHNNLALDDENFTRLADYVLQNDLQNVVLAFPGPSEDMLTELFTSIRPQPPTSTFQGYPYMVPTIVEMVSTREQDGTLSLAFLHYGSIIYKIASNLPDTWDDEMEEWGYEWDTVGVLPVHNALCFEDHGLGTLDQGTCVVQKVCKSLTGFTRQYLPGEVDRTG